MFFQDKNCLRNEESSYEVETVQELRERKMKTRFGLIEMRFVGFSGRSRRKKKKKNSIDPQTMTIKKIFFFFFI